MTDPIKILSISTSDRYGGAGRAAWQLHDSIRKNGHESRMLVKSKKTQDPDVLLLSSLAPKNRLYPSYEWLSNKCKNQWQHMLWRPYPEKKDVFLSDLRSSDFFGALKKIDYDILQLHWINLRFLPLRRLPKNKPIVWTLHDSWPFCGICHIPQDCPGYRGSCGQCPALQSTRPTDLSHRIWKKKQRIYQGLDLHIVAPSRWMAACAKKSSLLGDKDIRVIPNGIDTQAFSPGDRKSACLALKLDPEKRHLLFSAIDSAKDRNKGLQQLTEALNRIPEGQRRDWELILVGSRVPPEIPVSGLPVHNLGLIWSTEQMANAYRAADLTLVPSLSENLSYSIMESLACGTPVVAFNIGGNSDMVEHLVNGYLAEGLECEAFSKGILWCLEHNTEGSLSQSARQTILNRFTPEKVVKEYLDLYSDLIKR